MTLWNWADRYWARPGKSAALIALQDRHGQCTPLLLWALRSFDDGRPPDPAAIAEAIDLCRTESVGIDRLRAERRAAPPDVRAALLHRELEAERALLERLDAVSVTCGRIPADPAIILASISGLWGAPLQPADFKSLVEETADVG